MQRPIAVNYLLEVRKRLGSLEVEVPIIYFKSELDLFPFFFHSQISPIQPWPMTGHRHGLFNWLQVGPQQANA